MVTADPVTRTSTTTPHVSLPITIAAKRARQSDGNDGLEMNDDDGSQISGGSHSKGRYMDHNSCASSTSIDTHTDSLLDNPVWHVSSSSSSSSH